MEYVKGDLIKLALNGEFDVITHGCNCFCTMGSGIAVPMKVAFGVDEFPLEDETYKGDYNKLGSIDFAPFTNAANGWRQSNPNDQYVGDIDMYVVNSYTQYKAGKPTKPYSIPLDYDALMMCFRKINHFFPNQHIGIPQIGCGLAGGNWDTVEQIIKDECEDMKVTCVLYDG